MSYVKNQHLTPNHEDLFLSFHPRVLPLIFRSIICFKLITAYGMDIQLYLYHLLKKTIISQLSCLNLFIKNQLTISASFYFWILNSVLISLSLNEQFNLDCSPFFVRIISSACGNRGSQVFFLMILTQ